MDSKLHKLCHVKLHIYEDLVEKTQQVVKRLLHRDENPLSSNWF